MIQHALDQVFKRFTRYSHHHSCPVFSMEQMTSKTK
uniref:Uncharacterized protein n=1 Tax=Arundo donax TaxID=35708 RepID=A0A0A9FRB1_ARUDO